MSRVKAATITHSVDGANLVLNVDLSPLMEASGASFGRAYHDALGEEVQQHGMPIEQANRILARARALLLERGVETPEAADDDE